MAKNAVVTVEVVADTKNAQKGLTDVGHVAKDLEGHFTKSGHSAKDFGDSISNDLANKIPGVRGLMSKMGLDAGELAGQLGKAVPFATAAAGAAIAAFAVKSVSDFQHAAQEVLHFKDVSGLTADASSRWVAVGAQFGVAGEDISSAFGKMTLTAEKAPEKFEKFGIAVAHTKDGVYDANQTFLNAVDAIHKTDDAAQQAAIGNAVFGKSWQGLVKLTTAGTGEIKTAFDAVKKTELFTDKDLKRSEDYRKALHEFGVAIRGVEHDLGSALIPAFTWAAHQITDFVQGVKDAGDKLNTILTPIITVAGWLGIHAGATDENTAALKRLQPEFVGTTQKFHDQMLAVQDATDATNRYVGPALKAAGMQGYFAGQTKLAEEAVGKLGEAEKLYGANNDYRDFLDKQAAAAQKVIEKLQKLFDMKNEDVRSDLGLERASYAVIKAYDTMVASQQAVIDSKGLDHDANLKLLEDTNNYKSSILDMAEADAKQYGNKYKLLHENASATDIAAEAEKGYRLSLIATLQKMDPNDPEQKWLQGYIDTLYGIPSKVDTVITLNTSGVLPGQAGKLIGKYADGGYVPGPKGAAQLAVVHGGEYVVSNAMQARGGGGTVTNNVNIYVDGGDPAKVVAALKRYTQQNGPGWMAA